MKQFGAVYNLYDKCDTVNIQD